MGRRYQTEPSRNWFQHPIPSVLQNGDGLFTCHGRKRIQPLVDADAALQILEQAVDGQPRPVKTWRSAHPLRIYPDQGSLFIRNQCVLAHWRKGNTGAERSARYQSVLRTIIQWNESVVCMRLCTCIVETEPALAHANRLGSANATYGH